MIVLIGAAGVPIPAPIIIVIVIIVVVAARSHGCSLRSSGGKEREVHDDHNRFEDEAHSRLVEAANNSLAEKGIISEDAQGKDGLLRGQYFFLIQLGAVAHTVTIPRPKTDM